MSASRGFKDHFSGHAGEYARYRPDYPDALFVWLAAQAPDDELAWDAGTGNGQAALGLTEHFRRVYATDASATQISHARPHKAVEYHVEPAERCGLSGRSAALVTVGQALHWFDFSRFYAEVRRVLKPDGLFAAWTYELCEIDAAIDAVVRELYGDIVGPYWPPERAHVERAYRDLKFPFAEVDAPDFQLETPMDLAGFQAYLGTWSAVRRFRIVLQENPLDRIRGHLSLAWGEPELKRTVRWPLALRAGFNQHGS